VEQVAAAKANESKTAVYDRALDSNLSFGKIDFCTEKKSFQFKILFFFVGMNFFNFFASE
jgi:hypothetical protein